MARGTKKVQPNEGKRLQARRRRAVEKMAVELAADALKAVAVLTLKKRFMAMKIVQTMTRKLEEYPYPKEWKKEALAQAKKALKV